MLNSIKKSWIAPWRHVTPKDFWAFSTKFVKSWAQEYHPDKELNSYRWERKFDLEFGLHHWWILPIMDAVVKKHLQDVCGEQQSIFSEVWCNGFALQHAHHELHKFRKGKQLVLGDLCTLLNMALKQVMSSLHAPECYYIYNQCEKFCSPNRYSLSCWIDKACHNMVTRTKAFVKVP